MAQFLMGQINKIRYRNAGKWSAAGCHKPGEWVRLRKAAWENKADPKHQSVYKIYACVFFKVVRASSETSTQICMQATAL